MRALTAVLLLATTLSACSSVRDETSSSFGDFGQSIGGGFGRNTDTYGTQRRVDVYGGTTAPTLPSIGAPGMGK